MGREIRRVPANWSHPFEDGAEPHRSQYTGVVIQPYRPMFEGGEEAYQQRLQEWQEGCEEYGPEDMGEPYGPESFIPKGDWYQLFENVTEGTPLSPPFEKPDELVEWLADNRDYWGNQWSRETAINIVQSGYAFSMIGTREGFFTPESKNYWKEADDAN